MRRATSFDFGQTSSFCPNAYTARRPPVVDGTTVRCVPPTRSTCGRGLRPFTRGRRLGHRRGLGHAHAR
jgi:hypothetical protein